MFVAVRTLAILTSRGAHPLSLSHIFR
jgi:hypothetical protein